MQILQETAGSSSHSIPETRGHVGPPKPTKSPKLVGGAQDIRQSMTLAKPSRVSGMLHTFQEAASSASHSIPQERRNLGTSKFAQSSPPVKKAQDGKRTAALAKTSQPGGIPSKSTMGGFRSMFTKSKAAQPPATTDSKSPAVGTPISSSRPIVTQPQSQPNPSVYMGPGDVQVAADPSPLRGYSMRERSSQKVRKSTRKAARPATAPRSTGTNPATWTPPPLFQAYPEAIKHATLPSPAIPVDTILHMAAPKRDDLFNPQMAREAERRPYTPGANKAKSLHGRHHSSSSIKSDWTKKLYLLVDSGHILQYSGSGTHDRLPEKVLKLGKDSAAFACDVLPGKHWVLQITEAMESVAVPVPENRSFIARLTFRQVETRRTTPSVLLVLENAEDMESWMTTVRREIEVCGGKKNLSETGKPKWATTAGHLQPPPSHRYLVNHDPDRSPNPPTPITTTTFNESDHEESIHTQNSRNRPASPSLYAASTVTSSLSQDGRLLDGLRDSSHRYSQISSGNLTFTTSQASSSASSPTQDSFGNLPNTQTNDTMDHVRLRPNSFVISERRRSMAHMPNPVVDYSGALRTSRPRPQSTFTAPSRIRSDLNGAPNFSLPVSSERRHQQAKQDAHQAISTPQTTAPNLPTRSARRGPPTQLNMRPLSLVKDMPSPTQGPPVYTPIKSAAMIRQEHPSLINSLDPNAKFHVGPNAENNFSEQHANRRSSFSPFISSDNVLHVRPDSLRRHSSYHEDIVEQTTTNAESSGLEVPKIKAKSLLRRLTTDKMSELHPIEFDDDSPVLHSKKPYAKTGPAVSTQTPNFSPTAKETDESEITAILQGNASACAEAAQKPDFHVKKPFMLPGFEYTTSSPTLDNHTRSNSSPATLLPRASGASASSTGTRACMTAHARYSALPKNFPVIGSVSKPEPRPMSAGGNRRTKHTSILPAALSSPEHNQLHHAALQSIRESDRQNSLKDRRSMPQLAVLGGSPPLAPPPNCALPPLPIGSESPKMRVSAERSPNIRSIKTFPEKTVGLEVKQGLGIQV